MDNLKITGEDKELGKMKKDRILNPQIINEIAALGHTEYLCVADCGLPIPKDVKVVDVSVTAGIPKFMETVEAIAGELVIESYIVASEIDSANPALMVQIADALSGLSVKKISHEDFKKLTQKAKCIIRTGETLSYANVILVGGVNF